MPAESAQAAPGAGPTAEQNWLPVDAPAAVVERPSPDRARGCGSTPPAPTAQATTADMPASVHGLPESRHVLPVTARALPVAPSGQNGPASGTADTPALREEAHAHIARIFALCWK